MQGRYVEVGALYNRAISINEKALGPDHTETAKTLSYLAGLREAQVKGCRSPAVYMYPWYTSILRPTLIADIVFEGVRCETRI